MSFTLQVILIAAAVTTVVWILRNIRKFRVKMEDAIFWTFFAAILLVLALFPEISYRLSSILGVISPANLIFVIVIFLLVEKIFTLSIIVSQLEDKIAVLSAELALRTHSAEQKLARKEINKDEFIKIETEKVSQVE